jgi:hypothetical protein
MKHHTKEKGDIGNLKIAADLAEKGLKVFIPLSEHLAFDLVAFDQDTGIFYKIQSKFKKVALGKISVSLKTCYATKNGNVSRRYSNDAFDVLAVYCPDIDKVMYISNKEIENLKAVVCFRIDKPKTGVSGVLTTVSRMVEDYFVFPKSYG